MNRIFMFDDICEHFEENDVAEALVSAARERGREYMRDLLEEHGIDGIMDEKLDLFFYPAARYNFKEFEKELFRSRDDPEWEDAQRDVLRKLMGDEAFEAIDQNVPDVLELLEENTGGAVNGFMLMELHRGAYCELRERALSRAKELEQLSNELVEQAQAVADSFFKTIVAEAVANEPRLLMDAEDFDEFRMGLAFLGDVDDDMGLPDYMNLPEIRELLDRANAAKQYGALYESALDYTQSNIDRSWLAPFRDRIDIAFARRVAEQCGWKPTEHDEGLAHLS